MKYWKWEKGRQRSGYEKMLLAKAAWPIPFDCYLLKFPEGSEVPWHKDLSPRPGWDHYRINVVLRPAELGGDFRAKGGPLLNFPRFKAFRPDRIEHAVTKIVSGERLVLSIGFLIRRKELP
jgi:hypothetical protein